MQMSNMSGVDVRGFGNKLFICCIKIGAIINLTSVQFSDDLRSSIFDLVTFCNLENYKHRR